MARFRQVASTGRRSCALDDTADTGTAMTTLRMGRRPLPALLLATGTAAVVAGALTAAAPAPSASHGARSADQQRIDRVFHREAAPALGVKDAVALAAAPADADPVAFDRAALAKAAGTSLAPH